MTADTQHRHGDLRAMADRLEAYLHGDAPPQDPAFAHLRWMLVREVTLHLAGERAALERWQTEVGQWAPRLDLGFDDAFKQHIVKWSGASLSANWCRYCLETRAMLRRMRKRMAFEERAVFAVAQLS